MGRIGIDTSGLTEANAWKSLPSFSSFLPFFMAQDLYNMAFQRAVINPTCCICQENEATHYCKCTDCPTLFCAQCFPHHQSKNRRTHEAQPIAKLRKSPEEYMRKRESLERAIAELQKNLERVEQCSNKFAGLMQTCINYLTEYRTWWLQQLQRNKEELTLAIETAIQEATNCLDQGVEPRSALARAMWVLPTELLEVFSYTVSTPDLLPLCQSWAHYQNSLKGLCDNFRPIPNSRQVPRDFFAAISMDIMELYDFHTHKATKHSLPISIWSGYVQVDRTTVLIVGKEVLTLDLLTLQITPLPPLLTPRNRTGVAQMDSSVFAFGGSQIGYLPMTVCEKCSLPSTHWTPLPPMYYPRMAFTPCVFKALLYLASTAAYDHRAVESFSPYTETFTVLPVSLPSDLALGCGSVAFVIEGELVLLTNTKQIVRWKIEGEAHFRVSATDRQCSSLHPPLIVGTRAYIANDACVYDGAKVEKWSLETNDFLKSS